MFTHCGQYCLKPIKIWFVFIDQDVPDLLVSIQCPVDMHSYQKHTIFITWVVTGKALQGYEAKVYFPKAKSLLLISSQACCQWGIQKPCTADAFSVAILGAQCFGYQDTQQFGTFPSTLSYFPTQENFSIPKKKPEKKSYEATSWGYQFKRSS